MWTQQRGIESKSTDVKTSQLVWNTDGKKSSQSARWLSYVRNVIEKILVTGDFRSNWSMRLGVYDSVRVTGHSSRWIYTKYMQNSLQSRDPEKIFIIIITVLKQDIYIYTHQAEKHCHNNIL